MVHKIRILSALRRKYPDLSQKQIKNLLDIGGVKLNARCAGRHAWVGPADTLQITGQVACELPPNPAVRCRLIQKTPDYIFLYKEVGVHAVALRYSEQDSVANWLLTIDDNLRHVGPALESGLLHRLDYETSGLMVAARHGQAYQHLKSLFQRHAIDKQYVCQVSHKPPLPGVYTAFAGQKSRSSAKVFVRQQDNHAILKKIRTEILQTAQLAQQLFTVRLRLISGHRHQIRAHLASLGCPLRGDTLYGGMPAERLYLQALSLGFDDLHGAGVSVTLAPDF